MKAFQPHILRFDSLSSTNTEASRRAMQGAEEGLCIVAKEQTAGRGRLQRAWVSPAGAGLYFSIVLRPVVDAARWTLLPLMAALAVHDALRDACELETDIKWPNDILVGERKLCGILAETIDTSVGRAAIVGIGVNLTSEAFPVALRETATSVEAVTGKTVEPETLLQSLVRALQSRYKMFQMETGSSEIILEWSRRSTYANGKRVRISNGNETFVGVTRGLEPDGALRVKTDAGEIKVVRAGDVTIGFGKGV